MSVNLSTTQFLQPNLVAIASGVLVESGLPPANLKLEITETVVMENPNPGHADHSGSARSRHSPLP
ncbi:MAG: hypothetical protein WBA86_19270 [Nodosilinea sp.]